jgi:HlyD family secretion protein
MTKDKTKTKKWPQCQTTRCHDTVHRVRPRLLNLSIALLLACTSCSKTPVVLIAKPKKASISAIVSGVTSGKVEAEHHSVLAFGAVGRIEHVSVSVGDRVTKGAILANLENADLKAALNQAEREVGRVTQLKNSNVLSNKEVEAAVELRDVALGTYEKSLIKAPFDGVIAEKNIEVGQLSQITAVIPLAPLRIVDSEPRYVVVAVDEADLTKIKVDQSARVKIIAYQKEPLLGNVRKVVSYVSTMREQDRTIQVEVKIPKQDPLLPVGASADVDIITEVKEDALTIPTRAVLGRVNARFVFVVKDGHIQRQNVTVGLSNLDRTEIVSGVGEDTVVVANPGLVELKDGQKVTVTVE